jgi:hypothetical protein
MDFTNLAHVHLLLNHLPTIGFGVGVSLLAGSFFRKSQELTRASLIVLFVMALLAIPTYFSGNAAQVVIKDRVDVSIARIQAHESAALAAFLFMELTGLFAWLYLWRSRRAPKRSGRSLTAVLVLSLLTFGLMARAANMGGEIRHPEIVPAETLKTAASVDHAGFSVAGSVQGFVNGHRWVWPACETLHFVGLCLLFTVVLMVDLRMLGMAKKLSLASLYPLLPVGMLGFGINLFTGTMFFVAAPDMYTTNVAFFRKILLVVLAGLNVLYFILFDEPWNVGPQDDAPLTAKFVAFSALFLWLGVLYYGHMLPFIGNSF